VQKRAFLADSPARSFGHDQQKPIGGECRSELGDSAQRVDLTVGRCGYDCNPPRPSFRRSAHWAAAERHTTPGRSGSLFASARQAPCGPTDLWVAWARSSRPPQTIGSSLRYSGPAVVVPAQRTSRSACCAAFVASRFGDLQGCPPIGPMAFPCDHNRPWRPPCARWDPRRRYPSPAMNTRHLIGFHLT
jgi:hypothetical protein